MPNEEVLYAVAESVATLTFNRPEARNAFGDETRDHLARLLQQAEADDNVRCVVITGAGDAFAAGGDVKGMAKLQQEDDTRVLATRMQTAADVVELLRSMSKPVVAAINGAAAGGGMNLALACDIRYAADGAIFSQSFVKIGLVPDWGGHYFLPRMIGTSRAMELMMLGTRIDAEQALKLGLVNEVFPQESFRERVRERAEALAAGPRAAIAAIKRGVHAGAVGPLSDTLAFESGTQLEMFLSTDAREGVRAFVEKRRPKFNDD